MYFCISDVAASMPDLSAHVLAEGIQTSSGKADGANKKEGPSDVHAKVTAWVERELMPAINKQVTCLDRPSRCGSSKVLKSK
jgi:hypothetical protein